MDFKLIKEPDIEDDHPTLRSIAAALDSLDPNQEDPVLTLFPSENIDDSRYLQLQYCKDVKTGEVELFLSVMIEKENYEDKYYFYTAKNMDEAKEIFYNYFSSHKLPSLLYWTDDTEDLKEAHKRTMTINIFKEAFNIHRVNGKEIYKGFGFKHHSDVTQYYVHPNNQSSDGTTSLCQPIGESVVLFSLLLLSIINDKEPFGDYYYNENKSIFYLKFTVPEDWHSAGIIDKEVFGYKIYLEENNILFGAYDKKDSWLEDKIEPLTKFYKLLPCFVILLARETEIKGDFGEGNFNLLINNFIESPVADVFVNVNEDFYQNHKFNEYNINYCQPPYIDMSKFYSCSSSYEAVRENRQSSQEEQEVKITPFTSKSFKPEYKGYIPVLGNEFELQKELYCLCNAVQSGDSRAVLFHGPAGTGKTIACKLVCQAISLPILETINCTENLDEYVLGKYIPQGDKIIFMESFLTKAIRDGGAVVFEEINFAKPQYLAFLNSLLDDNGFVRLDSGEIVKRHQNFRFFATMNLGYYGTKELNQALFNRFNAVIELAALSDDSIRKMLSVRVPECIPFIEKMLSVYHKLRKKIENEELEIVISPRNLENWARLSRHEGFIKASEKTIIPIAKNDRALESAIKGIIYLHKWL
jgi:MoxR-like ATPase